MLFCYSVIMFAVIILVAAFWNTQLKQAFLIDIIIVKSTFI